MSKPEYILDEQLFREVVDAVAEAENVTSLDDLNRVFRPVFQHLGFSLFAGIEIANPRTHPVVRVVFGEGHEPWLARYLDEGYAEDDPMIKECSGTWDSFFWSDVVQRGELSPRAMHIMADARTFLLHDGFLAPLHKSAGSIFAVLLAGEHCDSQNRSTHAAAHLVASYYGVLGRSLHGATSAHLRKTQPLTERQRECLMWARRGKSSKDIGDILNICEDVVDEHIERACNRLGVSTRMQAVIAAMVEGYFN